MSGDILARVESLSISERLSGRLLVKKASFQVARGECLAIVGESGGGKTLCCKALMKLLPLGLKADGQAIFEGTDMLRASERQAREIRGSGMGVILQQPMSAFDPLRAMGAQIAEVLRQKLGLGKAEARERARAVLGNVNLEAGVCHKYPGQLSGGMLQRCMIALCLALQTRLIVADEPTTALDAQNQYEVLQRLKRLRERHDVGLIFISHDLGAAQALADNVLVMRQGECVEYGSAWQVFNRPQSDYAKHLVRTRLALTRSFERAMGEL